MPPVLDMDRTIPPYQFITGVFVDVGFGPCYLVPHTYAVPPYPDTRLPPQRIRFLPLPCCIFTTVLYSTRILRSHTHADISRARWRTHYCFVTTCAAFPAGYHRPQFTCIVDCIRWVHCCCAVWFVPTCRPLQLPPPPPALRFYGYSPVRAVLFSLGAAATRDLLHTYPTTCLYVIPTYVPHLTGVVPTISRCLLPVPLHTPPPHLAVPFTPALPSQPLLCGVIPTLFFWHCVYHPIVLLPVCLVCC